MCKLEFKIMSGEGSIRKGIYILTIDGVLATDLREAPPIKKENL